MCQAADGSLCSGVPGAKGDKGDSGAQGLQGVTGPQGVQGTQGSQGAKGDAGPQGVAGNAGAQGPQGPQGLQGAQGSPGAPGSKGDQGIAGPSVWVSATPDASQPAVVVGVLVPTLGGAAIYLTESKGSTGISNFPEGFVVSAQATAMIHSAFSGVCDSNLYTASSDHILANQLVWRSGDSHLYKINANLGKQTVVPCGGGSAFTGWQLTQTSYTFNPWTTELNAPLSTSLQ